MVKRKKGKKGSSPRKWLAWFDTHHRIELNFLLTTLSLGILAGSFGYSIHHSDAVAYKQSLTVNTSGQQVSFSKSRNTTVTLGTVQLSTDGKTAFIPFSFSSMQQIGIKADNYAIYLIDASKKQFQYKLSGRFYLYPSSDQGVLIITSPTQIGNEPLALGIMNEKPVTVFQQDQDEQNAQSSSDISFGNRDMAFFKINPGATDVRKGDRIDADTTQFQSVYSAVFGSPQVKKTLKSNENIKKKIATDMSAASAVIERLKSAGFVLPTEPDWLKDNWKPHNYIDPITGKTLNGSRPSRAVQDANALPRQYSAFPETLKSTRGQSMNESMNSATQDNGGNTNTNGTGATAANGSSSSDTPLAEWQNLQAIWTDIAQQKLTRDLTNNYQLYQIKKAEASVVDQATMTTPKHVIIINPMQK